MNKKNNKKKINKKNKKKLPNKLFKIENNDKKFHEKWTIDRNKINFPHPFRSVVIGRPNCGKSTTVKNLIIFQDPPFKRVIVIHCDPEYTKEYDDIDVDFIMSDIPKPNDEMFDGKIKTMIILDDLEYKFMIKQQLRNLDRLFGFVSTHKNVSIALCSQDTFNTPSCIRRMSNLWILWKPTDLDSLNTISRRIGIKKEVFRELFEKNIHDTHDSLWFDMTNKSPYKIRKNGFELIN